MAEQLLFLVSNDDGYQSRGIKTLAHVLREFAKVFVVAPDRNRSGASNSLTLEHPLRLVEAGADCFHVNGTPTDCVHIAIAKLLPRLPDMVITGVNAGENLADDVFYSGTVAAAMEGRFLGCPAIAVSLAGGKPSHYDTAAWAVRTLIQGLLVKSFPEGRLLNVNVPDVPIREVRGFKATRLGERHKATDVVAQHDPRGRPIYWMGPAGAGNDVGPGTDFEAIANGYVSVTPLQIDLTQHDTLNPLAEWLQGVIHDET